MATSPPSTKSNVILRVAMPSPVRRLFDYYLPQQCDISPQIGARVRASFGKRIAIGIIVEIKDTTNITLDKLKPINELIDAEPILPPIIMQLCIWSSSYYQYPLGLLLQDIIPSWLKKNPDFCYEGLERFNDYSITSPFALNTAQINAVTAVQKSFGQFKPFLLDGVTGSGKTEVYMQLITHALQRGLQVLILVPEINLTPQTLLRFAERFPVPIAVLHSQVSEKKRALAWWQAKIGVAPIVVGTRLAAFVPLLKPGLFIIDEEHDLSFKQQDHLRYSARDLILKRAQLENCPVLLGTATPALETWHNTLQQKFTHITLPERAGNAKLPEFKIVDIRNLKLNSGLSHTLLEEIKIHLAQNSQVLLFLNRRGYAPAMICYHCGWHQKCRRCDSNMILHLTTNTLRCHHCNASAIVPHKCPECQSTEIAPIGLGTQKLEQILIEQFPNAKIARVDSDTVHTQKQLQTLLAEIHSGEINIIVGTQMLAKGHHFPNITLVAIVDIDAALFSADFRAIERAGQVITQVAGRTGRGNKVGTVLLQTTQPDNPLLRALIEKGYHTFLQYIYSERKSANLPPFSYQALLRAESKQPTTALNFLENAKHYLSSQQAINYYGPIASPMEKKQGFYRAQLLIQANSRKILQAYVHHVTKVLEDNPKAKTVRWSVDVDPVDLF